MFTEKMEALEVPLRLLRFTGLVPEKNSTRLRKISGVFFYYSNSIFVLSIMIELNNYINNYAALTGLLSTIISPTSYFFKITMFRNKEKHFAKIIELSEKEEFQNDNKDFEIIRGKSVKLTTYISISYTVFCAIVITLYSLEPFMVHVDLPVPISYNKGIPNSIIYGFQVFGMYTILAIIILFNLKC